MCFIMRALIASSLDLVPAVLGLLDGGGSMVDEEEEEVAAALELVEPMGRWRVAIGGAADIS
jgi:hypothetical protein